MKVVKSDHDEIIMTYRFDRVVNYPDGTSRTYKDFFNIHVDAKDENNADKISAAFASAAARAKVSPESVKLIDKRRVTPMYLTI